MTYQVNIDAERCVGCGLCVTDCPSRVIAKESGKAVITSEACIKCGHCVAICPTEAVTISDLNPEEVVDYDTLPPLIAPDAMMGFIKRLRTIRQFTEEPVAPSVIEDIIEVGRFTATAVNRQGVRYIVVRDDIDRLEQLVLPKLRGLQKLSKIFGKALPLKKDLSNYTFDSGFVFKNAPVAILVVSTSDVDAALAAKSMEMHARTHGLGGLHVGIFTTFANRSNRIRRTLNLKHREKVVACLALGHPDVTYRRTVPRREAVVEWR